MVRIYFDRELRGEGAEFGEEVAIDPCTLGELQDHMHSKNIFWFARHSAGDDRGVVGEESF